MQEEALTQEMAEFLAYRSSNKQRPNPTVKQFYSEVDVLTNFDCYGVFQNVTANFGRTLRGCSTRGNFDCDVLFEMLKKALTSDYKSEVIAEYNDGDARLYKDLFESLRLMGLLKEWQYNKYGVSGYWDKGTNAKDTLNQLNQITERNRDYRSYPAGGFPKVNFELFKNKKEQTRKRELIFHIRSAVEEGRELDDKIAQARDMTKEK